MKKSRFTEAQIIGVLRQAEGEVPIPDLCREHAISAAIFYSGRSKFRGMDASMVTEMKSIQEGNRRLKKMDQLPHASLSLEQKNELAALVEAGPYRQADGVVRWRRIDLKLAIKKRFGVDFHERYPGTLLKKLGFPHVSATLGGMQKSSRRLKKLHSNAECSSF